MKIVGHARIILATSHCRKSSNKNMVNGKLFRICCVVGCMVCYDLPGSLQTEIERTFAVPPYVFEYLYSVYCFPNIVQAYLGGLLIDRYCINTIILL